MYIMYQDLFLAAMPVVRVAKENAVPSFSSKSKRPAALFPVGDMPEDLAICQSYCL